MGPPKPPVPHVAPIYRVTATALGAGMWFWLMYRAKKDGKATKHPIRIRTSLLSTSNAADFSQAPYCWDGSTLGTTRQFG
ncbi:hypothetical protein V8C35DRAFT_312283 [Trichoderma chlorosporum]